MLENKKRLKPSHTDLLPHIRVAARNPETVVISRPGRLMNMGLGGEVPDILMDGDDDEEDQMEE